MQLAKGLFERGGACDAGLDEQQVFFSAFDIALPAINGVDRADDVHAGGQFALDQSCRECVGLGAIGDGCKCDADGLAGIHAGEHLTYARVPCTRNKVRGMLLR